MREAGGRHQVGHAHAVEAALAEEPLGRLDHVRPIRLRLGDFHACSRWIWSLYRRRFHIDVIHHQIFDNGL